MFARPASARNASAKRFGEARVDADPGQLVVEVGRFLDRAGQDPGDAADRHRASQASECPGDRIDVDLHLPRGAGLLLLEAPGVAGGLGVSLGGLELGRHRHSAASERPVNASSGPCGSVVPSIGEGG